MTPSSSGVAEVVVAPGYAIDPCGREILLTDAVTIPLPASGASTIAVRAVETAVGDNVLRDDVEVTIVSDPLPPWIVLASVETEGAGVRVEMSVRGDSAWTDRHRRRSRSHVRVTRATRNPC